MKKWITATIAGIALAIGLTVSAGAATQTGNNVWDAGIRQHAVTRINGKIHVPTVYSTCGSSSMVAAWVGIGGYGQQKFAQLGLTLYPNGVVGAWYEADVTDTNYVEATVPMTIHAGDYVQLSMAFLNNETEVEFKWWDTTNGALHYVTLQNAGQYWGSGTAEWVMERVEGNPVANFGTAHWYDAWWGTPTTAVDASPLDIEDALIDTSGYTLATVSGVSTDPQALNFTWHRCT